MRAILTSLALKVPQLRALVEERNHLRDELGRLLQARVDGAPGSGVPADAGALAYPRLHLGCGTVKLDGWCNVDVLPTRAADVVDDIRTLPRFRDGSAEELYACHVLEHFAHAEIVPILSRWRDVLAPGGRLRISVPDLDRIVKIYAAHWDHFQRDGNSPWVGLVYGGQLDPFDFHKTGFNLNWLRHLLRQAGFRDAQPYPVEPHFLPGVRDASLAKEPFGETFSLNVLATR